MKIVVIILKNFHLRSLLHNRERNSLLVVKARICGKFIFFRIVVDVFFILSHIVNNSDYFYKFDSGEVDIPKIRNFNRFSFNNSPDFASKIKAKLIRDSQGKVNKKF